jgi:TPR repeat protein
MADTWLIMAEQGDAAAQYKVGLYFDQGSNGFEEDPAAAVAWYRRSASQGVVAAQYKLACNYWFGRGVENDFVEACRLYERVRAMGYRSEAATVVRPASGKSSWKPPLWYRPAADARYNHAQYRLGECYAIGDGVGKDDEAAAVWYDIASSRSDFSPAGHPSAQLALGTLYFEGRGVGQDEFKAATLWNMAALQEEPGALNNLGALHQEGIVVPRDEARGFQLYVQASALGHSGAQFNVGQCYAAGRGVEQDFEEAAGWYSTAAERGHLGAIQNLAICYAHGLGVLKDSVRALELFESHRIAVEQFEDNDNRAWTAEALRHAG